MPIQDRFEDENDPENYKRPRWDPALVEDEDDDIVDDDSDDDDSEEDEDSSSSSDGEEASDERCQMLRAETAELEAEANAVEAIRREECELRDKVRQDTRRIEAQIKWLREQRDREMQILAEISENARRETQILAEISENARAIEDSGVQTAGEHPLDVNITKASVDQAETSTDHIEEQSTSNRTDDIVI